MITDRTPDTDHGPQELDVEQLDAVAGGARSGAPVAADPCEGGEVAAPATPPKSRKGR